jgi:HlyD family secretion protein
MKRWIILATIVLVAASVLYMGRRSKARAADLPKTVTVVKGNVAQEAVALGSIVPEQEVSVKSKLPGIVDRVHVAVGDFVQAGAPLIDIRPDPTPLERAEAERNLQIARVTEEGARKDLERAEGLAAKGLGSEKQLEQAKQDFDRARLSAQLSAERLQLLKSGHARIEGQEISTRVVAPATGTILTLEVNPGDPVVPLTSYQEGTVLMTMADMGSLVFKGTVDEVDVGKLNTGQPVRFTVGAIPDREVSGILRKISPKARKQESATIFDVEADLVPVKDGPVLRAGYSTTARIAIARAESVLVVPERCVKYEGTDATVRLPGKDGKPTEKKITTGLSDGLTVEVKDGLAAGDKVLEPAAAKLGKK